MQQGLDRQVQRRNTTGSSQNTAAGNSQIKRPEERSRTESASDSASGRGSAERSDQKEKKLASGMREIQIEEMMSSREEMSAEATPLSGRTRTPFAGAVAASGTGIRAAVGGILRLLKYLKEVR